MSFSNTKLLLTGSNVNKCIGASSVYKIYFLYSVYKTVEPYNKSKSYCFGFLYLVLNNTPIL